MSEPTERNVEMSDENGKSQVERNEKSIKADVEGGAESHSVNIDGDKFANEEKPDLKGRRRRNYAKIKKEINSLRVTFSLSTQKLDSICREKYMQNYSLKDKIYVARKVLESISEEKLLEIIKSEMGIAEKEKEENI
jgi:hypothetical protein